MKKKPLSNQMGNMMRNEIRASMDHLPPAYGDTCHEFPADGAAKKGRNYSSGSRKAMVAPQFPESVSGLCLFTQGISERIEFTIFFNTPMPLP